MEARDMLLRVLAPRSASTVQPNKAGGMKIILPAQNGGVMVV